VFRFAPRRRTLEAALRDAADTSPGVRRSAIRDLTALASDAARTRVLAVLEKALADRAAEVRAEAAVALADVEGVEALPSLLFAVEDDDPYVRQMAISALGEVGDPRARQRLERALGDPRPEVRFQAVIAFARVAPEEAGDVLLQALEDADPNIRYIAIRVAEEQADKAGGAVTPELLARIGRLLADDDTAVRVGAAVALARAGDATGASVLSDVVAGRLRTREPEDEAIAVELCGEMGLSGTQKELERRAFGLGRFRTETFAWQAKVALARMGHSRARTQIVRDLTSRSRDRRTLAVAAAGRARLEEARAVIESMRGDEARAEQEAVVLALEQLSSGRAGDAS
jgi:HEAT repeat protein